MIDVRPYQKGDAYRIKNLYPEFKLDIDHLVLADEYMPKLPMVSLVKGDEVIVVYGAGFIHDKNMEVFSIMGEEVKKNVRWVLVATKDLINWLVEKHNLERVQMVVDAHNEIAQTWAEHLGFIAEGVMPSYKGHGRDYIMYGRYI
jgi:hypothetical protein